MKNIIVLLLLILICQLQDINFVIKPSDTYNQINASPEACYADCRSCQIRTNQCEECFSPYFVRNQNGLCQLVDIYTLQSVVNQLYFGNAFVPADLSWSNSRTTVCQPSVQFLEAPLKILGPYTPGNTIVYRRSVAFHQYIVIKFQLIKMNWDASSSLTINIYDQNQNIIATRMIGHSPNIPKQRLCSNNVGDQRLSVLIQFTDNKVTFLYMNMTFVSTNPQSSWGISTFLLITGFCDFSCSKCRYSFDQKQCVNCNNFLMTGTDGRCSQCYRGFKLVNLNGIIYCQKCQIEFQICIPGQQLCYYRQIADQVDSANCTFKEGRDLSSVYDADSMLFSGSLMTINGKPSIYQCGQYSLIGLAQQGDFITRIFNLKPHFFISISFNIMVIDQDQSLKTNLFVIVIDNIIVEATNINTETISNTCGNQRLQAFVTFRPTRFYSHTKQNNTNITITSNAVNWGIRNLRISYRICDSSCLQCGANGCLQCTGYFQLKDLKCTSCLPGYGIVINTNQSLNTCVQCPQNCLTCTAQSTNSSIIDCLICSNPYFLFQNKCKLKTNVGSIIPIDKPSTSSSSVKTNGGYWSSSSPTVNTTSCVVNLPSSGGRNVDFTVAINNLKSIISINQDHYKKIIEFYLIKIDRWNRGDRLDIYLNDLLILSKTFIDFGNNVCSKQNQLDLISFQTLEFVDSNKTLTVYFEVVSETPNSVRLFGIDKFKVYPVGCESCSNFPFNYQLKYNYDNGLKVHVQFNRVYINTNQTLFKQIFQLYIQTRRLNYSIISNNSVTYILQAFPPNQKQSTNITIICRYPELVQTQTTNQISKNPFFQVRALQALSNYQILKTIDNNQSQVIVTRYSPIDNVNAIDGIRIFFQVVSRIVIYIGFALFFVGCQTSCTHFMHNLQKIWLHIFIASLTIPSALKFTLVGFRETQNQNIAINPSNWESSLPTELYYDTPAYFQSYYRDIGFFRNIYNIAIAFIILCIVSLLFHFILKLKDIGRSQNSGLFWRHMRITFVKRPFFVFNSIVFYQYLTLVLACTLQFTGFLNETNQGSYGGLNSAAAIVTFIIATLYPIFQFYYLRKQWLQHEKDRKIEYYNRYHEIFFRICPEEIWIQNSIGLTYSQRIFNLYRFGQLWWICLLATIFYGSPNAQCFLLFITNTMHLAIVLFSAMSYTLFFKIFKFLQLAFFVGLQIIILVCYSQRDTLTNRGYNTLGYVGIALIFAILLLSFMRSVYTFWKIYSEYNTGDRKQKNWNIKTRNEDYFDPIELSQKQQKQ